MVNDNGPGTSRQWRQRTCSASGSRDPLQSGFWSTVAPRYQRLVLVPSNLCTREGFVDYTAFSLLAGRHGLAINAGLTARYDVDRAKSYCDELDLELRSGPKSAGSLYIVRPDLVSRLARDSGAGTTCTLVDGFGVCFAAESYAAWQDTFDIVRARLPSTEELMRFEDGLNDAYRQTLKRAPHAAAPAALRIEGLARYLAYRAEGCDDNAAVSKTLARVTERDERRASAARRRRCTICRLPTRRLRLPARSKTAFAEHPARLPTRPPSISRARPYGCRRTSVSACAAPANRTRVRPCSRPSPVHPAKHPAHPRHLILLPVATIGSSQSEGSRPRRPPSRAWVAGVAQPVRAGVS